MNDYERVVGRYELFYDLEKAVALAREWTSERKALGDPHRAGVCRDILGSGYIVSELFMFGGRLCMVPER